jgi:colanic acid biosynthesis protein WcaH
MIPPALYKKTIGLLPIFCVDVVIRDRAGRYLLVKRKNQPLKGCYWVVGGRVHRGELAKVAAQRKMYQEVGLHVKRDRFRLVGYTEAVFKRNAFGTPTGVHTVSVVYCTEIDGSEPIRLDAQSATWKFSDRLPKNFKIREFSMLS